MAMWRCSLPARREPAETAAHPAGANLSLGLCQLSLHDETIRDVGSEVLHG